MKILSIDTSHPRGSAAFRLDARTIRGASFGKASSHLVGLSECVAALLQGLGARADDIDRVALVSGPGSFTGLRIGLAYVKGLFAGLGTEVVTMTSLELLATRAAQADRLVCPMIDARKSEVYAAIYRESGRYSSGDVPRLPRMAEECPPRAMAPEKFLASREVRPTVFVGSGAARFRALIETAYGRDAVFAGDPCDRPSTKLLCHVAEFLPPLSPTELLNLEPFYIRPSDAKLQPLKRIRAHD